MLAAWLAWLGIILAFVGIDLLREADRSIILSIAGVKQRSSWQKIAEGIGPVVSIWLPVVNMDNLRQKLVWAGEPLNISAEGFIGLKVISLAGGAFIGALLSVLGLPPVFLTVLAVLAYLGPDYYLSGNVEKRKNKIYRDMPGMIGLMATVVKAGVELIPALETVGSNMPGPLGEELRRTWREIATGRPRSVSLRSMAKRTGVPVVERFVETIITAEESGGMNISEALSRIMLDLRGTQSRKAQEAGRKIPTKLNLPLLLCIFLPMLVMLLYPVLVTVMKAL